jgi:hypothetical protein
MKTESSHPPHQDRDLSRILGSWRVSRATTPDFHKSVWRRIARVHDDRERSPATVIQRWLGEVFTRPAWSVGYALVLLTVGLLGGYFGAREQTARWDQHLAQRYVQSVDPYFNPR